MKWVNCVIEITVQASIIIRWFHLKWIQWNIFNGLFSFCKKKTLFETLNDYIWNAFFIEFQLGDFTLIDTLDVEQYENDLQFGWM